MTSTYTLHGITIRDRYQWLEDPDKPQTKAWIEEQNARTEALLCTIPQRERIRKRITELWNYERCSVPSKEGSRYFFTKNNGLQNQAVLYTRDRLDGIPRILIDPNTLVPDGTVALTTIQPSRNGHYVVYGTAGAGSDWEEWRVLDVDSGRETGDHLKWIKFSTVAWGSDNQGFYYCRYNEPVKEEEFHGTNYFQKVFYHRLGTPQLDDVLIYDRPDSKELSFGVVTSDDGRYLILQVWVGTEVNNLLFYFDLQEKEGAIVPLISTFEARYRFIGNDGPVFWLETDQNAPRGRLVSIDTRHPEPEFWRELIPQSQNTLEHVSAAGEAFIACYLKDAHAKVSVFDLEGRFVRELELPGIASVTGFQGKRDDFETFYDFTGFATPPCVYRYDVSTGESTIFHQPQLNFNPGDYRTHQVFYPSKDGTLIPMFLSYKSGLDLDGNNPVELYGYGGFSISLTPVFSISRLAWMEMGGIYAVANLRGGGEYGEDWHQAGSKLRKQNVFDDFIAGAEWLIENKYTSSSRLAISGRSNGGLLVGACMTQRPELFAAAIPGVGVMDMLRFHRFTIGWSWVSDYGSPDNPEDFKALYAYSPYHNIVPGTAYPATLIVTGDHDDRVVPAHSYKFAAALQEAQAGAAPILIRIDVRAGHGIGKPTAKLIGEVTDILSFLTQVLQVK